jgi:hypothetical protein
MDFAQHAPIHDFGKNKFTAKESNITIVYVSTIFMFPAKWATGTELTVNEPYNPDLLLIYVQLYPKQTFKLGQPKSARAPNIMVCTAARFV